MTWDRVTANPKVVIIILNYNGWKDTIECIESVRKIDYDNYETILLDNGSEDDSLEMIRLYSEGLLEVDSKFSFAGRSRRAIEMVLCPWEGIEDINELPFSLEPSSDPRRLIVIRTGSNRGFVGGNNFAVRYALKFLAPDFVLLLNNDTVVRPDFLAELVKTAMTDHSIGLVQSKLLFYHDRTINNVGVAMSPLGVVTLRGMGESDTGQYDGLCESGFFFAAGTCLLIGRELLANFGDELFDRVLFSYNEDMDLSWRARMLGFRILVCTSSICYHKGGNTAKMLGRSKDLWMFRNIIRIFLKNCSFVSLVPLIPVMLLRYSTSSLQNLYRTGDTEGFRILVRSMVWNLELLNDTLCRRHDVQRNRIVGDRIVRRHMARESLLG